MYQIKISGNNVFASEYCNFCGGYFEAGDVICYLAEDEEKFFLVCDRCLEAGTEGFPSILRNRVRRLKKFAAFLEYLSNQKIEYSREEHERLKKESEEYWISFEKENKFFEDEAAVAERKKREAAARAKSEEIENKLRKAGYTDEDITIFREPRIDRDPLPF